MEQTIRIMAEPQMNPDQCKFILEQPIYEGGSFHFQNAKEANGSALAEAVFEVCGVRQVFVANDHLLITKESQDDWRTVGKDVGAAIRKALTSGKPLIADDLKSQLPNEESIRVRVTELLNERINPAIAAHGGFIELLEVKSNNVYLKMGGGCQGCGMASMTVKQGVEQMLRQELPYIGAIYDVTDHAAGDNPYFK